MLDGEEDGEYNGVGFVELSKMVVTLGAFLFGTNHHLIPDTNTAPWMI